MIQIKPILLGLPKKEGVSFNVRPINIKLFQDTCGSYWQIFDKDGIQLADGNLDIPSEIYLKWAEDDNIIVDYVLSELGLEKTIENE